MSFREAITAYGLVYSFAPFANAMFLQWSRSASSFAIFSSSSSSRAALRSRDLRAARVLRARFIAIVSDGSSTTIGGRGLSRLRELTPATEEWRPDGGELAEDLRR